MRDDLLSSTCAGDGLVAVQEISKLLFCRGEEWRRWLWRSILDDGALLIRMPNNAGDDDSDTPSLVPLELQSHIYYVLRAIAYRRNLCPRVFVKNRFY